MRRSHQTLLALLTNAPRSRAGAPVQVELAGHVTTALVHDLLPAINQWVEENYQHFNTYPDSVPEEIVDANPGYVFT